MSDFSLVNFEIDSSTSKMLKLFFDKSFQLRFFDKFRYKNSQYLFIISLTGMFQLLTQGSADLILDACTDFWDGDDLCELSTQDR